MARAEPLTRIRPRTIGRIEGIALVYNVVDHHGTVFAPGCLDRAKRDRLAAGEIRFFLDHGDSTAANYYRSRFHIGTVRRLTSGRLRDDTRAEFMVADVFDTPMGREAMTYVDAVLQNETVTGISVGFAPRAEGPTTIAGRRRTLFTDCDLFEISVTAMASVPGARVTGIEWGPVVEQMASEADRLQAVRQSFALPSEAATMADRLRAAA
jgi:phage head maturation protease